MATATGNRPRIKDSLSDAELAAFLEVSDYLEPGLPYLWVMDFGWASVGFYVKHLTPNRILVAHCSHFRNAGKDYGKLATEGAGNNCEWRYEGLVEINTSHILKTTTYGGTVHRGNLLPAS